MPVYKTAGEYIANQTEEAQLILETLRHLIKEAVPEVQELKNCKVPSFTLIPGVQPKQQMMIAAYAKYVSFYPHQAAVNHFSNELSDFELGRGTVKFPFNKPLPRELIKRMVVFRKEELENKP